MKNSALKSTLIGMAFILFATVSNASNQDSREIDLKNKYFNSIEAGTAIEVELVHDNKNYVELIGSLKFIEQTEVNVDENTLKLYRKKSLQNISNYKVKAIVHYSTLNEIEVSSAASVCTRGTLKAEKLSIEISSAAMAKITVEAYSVSIEASSAAKADIQVMADRMKIEASSAATVEIKGKIKDVDAEASSAARIDFTDTLIDAIKAEASTGSTIDFDSAKSMTTEVSTGAYINCKNKPTNYQKGKDRDDD